MKNPLPDPFLISSLHRRRPDPCAAGHDAPDRVSASLPATIARNLILGDELAGVLRALALHDLPSIPIRGLALAEQLYGDFAVRPIGDLDLLVRKETLSEVAKVLLGLGYHEIDRRPGFARTYSYTLEFVKDRHGMILVEPHWTLAYPPIADLVDMERVWRRAVPCRLLGLETWRLSQPDLFLHLSFHLLHKWADAPLLWFYELDQVIRQDPAALDWEVVLQTARETGQGALLARVAEKARDLFQSPIPDSVISQLASTRAASSSAPSARRSAIRALPLLLSTSDVDGRESLAQLFRIQGLRARCRYAFALLFPSRHFMRLHYGGAGPCRLSLHYCTRLLYLLREGGKGLWKLLAAQADSASAPHA